MTKWNVSELQSFEEKAEKITSGHWHLMCSKNQCPVTFRTFTSLCFFFFFRQAQITRITINKDVHLVQYRAILFRNNDCILWTWVSMKTVNQVQRLVNPLKLVIKCTGMRFESYSHSIRRTSKSFFCTLWCFLSF